MKPCRRKLGVRLLGSIMLIAAGLAGVGVYRQVRWKRFAVVVPGAIYRSGQLRPGQLTAAIEQLGLRTVIGLNLEQAQSEQQLCARYAVRFVHRRMPASGLGEPRDFRALVELLRDPSAHPVLLHCQAGVARTGAVVALFRILEQHWTLDAALAELRSFERLGRIDPKLEAHIRRLAGELADRPQSPALR